VSVAKPKFVVVDAFAEQSL
jgi:hypothetical protein